jgi:hypothetical protein
MLMKSQMEKAVETDESADESVDVSECLENASSALEKLSGAFASGDVSEKDQGRLEALKSQLSQLKESLNMEPGADPEPQTKPTGRLTAEAGAKDVKPVY